ncbi:hypothetical protein JI435_023120 [Parastagonospora nodorum SN15]|uniref:Uncharacterized protein n=1 Tax=Phaeosphaeria nodorum (strain SN15 / ATCC MYA-4574 / FGSC 10173) TaxID=321614 RepID=A0A7U2HVF8_PHANO|nr:hypothetical protein JI435_023120 [Parastagonospora nodorum SN15]
MLLSVLPILSLATTIIAAAAPALSNPNTSLYVCTDSSWRGTCANMQITVSDCRTPSPPMDAPFRT